MIINNDTKIYIANGHSHSLGECNLQNDNYFYISIKQLLSQLIYQSNNAIVFVIKTLNIVEINFVLYLLIYNNVFFKFFFHSFGVIIEAWYNYINFLKFQLIKISLFLSCKFYQKQFLNISFFLYIYIICWQCRLQILRIFFYIINLLFNILIFLKQLLAMHLGWM